MSQKSHKRRKERKKRKGKKLETLLFWFGVVIVPILFTQQLLLNLMTMTGKTDERNWQQTTTWRRIDMGNDTSYNVVNGTMRKQRSQKRKKNKRTTTSKAISLFIEEFYNKNRNSSTRTTTMMATSDNNGNNIHTCTFQNETYTMPYFPTFIIAGAQKTGTTSLGTYFSRHPLLVATRGGIENHFFDKRIHRIYGQLDNINNVPPEISSSSSSTTKSATTTAAKRKVPSRYEMWCKIRKEYFDTWPTERLTEQPYLMFFEKTPSYITDPQTPFFLKKTCPWIPKVIMTLRDPVDRAYSLYKMMVLSWHTNTSFEEYITMEINQMRKLNMTTTPTPYFLIDQNDEHTNGGSNANTAEEELHIDDFKTTQGQDDGGLLPNYNHPILPTYWTTKRNHIYAMSVNGDKVGIHVRRGLYSIQIQNWFANYHKESILILNYDEFKRNTSSIYYQILDFAGIPHNDIQMNDDVNDNNNNNNDPNSYFKSLSRRTYQNNITATSSSSSSFPPMKEKTRRYLQAFFAPYNKQLETILDDDTNKWKDIWTTTN